MISPPDVSETRLRAESLWEELGNNLCVCQRAEVPHWCEDCQRCIDSILAAFTRHGESQRDRTQVIAALLRSIATALEEW